MLFISRIASIHLVVMCGTVVHAADQTKSSQTQSFKVPRHGQLVLAVPEGWKQSIEQSPTAGLPPTIKFSAMNGRFEMLITPLWSQDGDPSFTSSQNVHKLLEAAGNQILASSKETSLDIKELKGGKAGGCYYTLTDKAPEPGGYEYITGAFVAVGDLLVSATMLHHQKDLPAREAGLEMLKGAMQKASDPAASKQGGDLRVSPPGAAWQLVLPGHGLTILDDQADDARKARRVMVTNSETGLTISVFMEPAQKDGDSTAVRAVYWGRGQQSGIPKKNIKLAKLGDIATVEYMVDQIEGVRLNQKNMNLYMVHEGTWIDIHISKTGFTDKDQSHFDDIAKGLKFEPTAAAKH